MFVPNLVKIIHMLEQMFFKSFDASYRAPATKLLFKCVQFYRHRKWVNTTENIQIV